MGSVTLRCGQEKSRGRKVPEGTPITCDIMTPEMGKLRGGRRESEISQYTEDKRLPGTVIRKQLAWTWTALKGWKHCDRRNHHFMIHYPYISFHLLQEVGVPRRPAAGSEVVREAAYSNKANAVQSSDLSLYQSFSFL